MGYLRWRGKQFNAKEPEKEKLVLRIISPCSGQKLFIPMNVKMFLVFLSRRRQHAFFVLFCFLAGFSAIRFLQHHPQISFRFCCKSLCILAMLSLSVLRVPSANKSHCTDGRLRHIGGSLIKMQNKRGPRIDPWGTPFVTDVYWEYVPFTCMHSRRPFK